jgi:hypothetical protein
MLRMGREVVREIFFMNLRMVDWIVVLIVTGLILRGLLSLKKVGQVFSFDLWVIIEWEFLILL